MSITGNGRPKVNWQSLVATFGAVGTLFLGTYTYLESQAQNHAVVERNDRQHAICDSVNRLNDAVGSLIRDATGISGYRNPEQAQRAETYKISALEELRRARCIVTDVSIDHNPLGLERIGGSP